MRRDTELAVLEEGTREAKVPQPQGHLLLPPRLLLPAPPRAWASCEGAGELQQELAGTGRADGGQDKREQWEHPDLCNPLWYAWYQLLFLPSLPSIYVTGINKPSLLSPRGGSGVSGARSPLKDPAASAGGCTEEAVSLVSVPTRHCHQWGWHPKPGLRHSQTLGLSGMVTGAQEGIFPKLMAQS